MCAAWQSMGLWALVGLIFLAGLVIGLMGGVGVERIRMWWRRLSVHLKAMAAAAPVVAKVVVVLVVVGFVFYEWTVM